MNADTGHLVRLAQGAAMPASYKPIPPHLSLAANRKLAGRSEATVSLTSGGKLSRFAALCRRAERLKKRNRSNNKQAAASRRQNRANG